MDKKMREFIMINIDLMKMDLIKMVITYMDLIKMVIT